MNNYPTLQTLAAGVSDAAAALFILIEAAVFVVGFFFLIASAKRLRDAGTDRRWGLGNAVPLALAGVLLIFLARTIDVSNQTLYETDAIWLYAPAANDWSTYVVFAVIQIVRVIGLLGLVRGINSLRYTGHESAQSLGAVSRALVFIASGIAALNIVLTTRVVVGTLGLESPFNP